MGLLVSRPCTATLGNNLYIHALIWREYPRVGRPKDIVKCKFRYSVESWIYYVNFFFILYDSILKVYNNVICQTQRVCAAKVTFFSEITAIYNEILRIIPKLIGIRYFVVSECHHSYNDIFFIYFIIHLFKIDNETNKPTDFQHQCRLSVGYLFPN
jgi:hypothetical protein